MSDSAMHLHLILTFKSRALLWWKLLCDGVVMLMGGREQLLVFIKRMVVIKRKFVFIKRMVVIKRMVII